MGHRQQLHDARVQKHDARDHTCDVSAVLHEQLGRARFRLGSTHTRTS
jgi:hypothetical protein